MSSEHNVNIGKFKNKKKQSLSCSNIYNSISMICGRQYAKNISRTIKWSNGNQLQQAQKVHHQLSPDSTKSYESVAYHHRILFCPGQFVRDRPHLENLTRYDSATNCFVEDYHPPPAPRHQPSRSFIFANIWFVSATPASILCPASPKYIRHKLNLWLWSTAINLLHVK